jgi:AcrR family transcriptional regulator
MKARASRTEPLSIERWRSAALRALAEGGVAAVAIEPLAKQLGVTKGSGYWHFENRDALLSAALEEWETKATHNVIAKLEQVDDPRQRLVDLFRQALGGTLDSRVYFALASADQHPVVAASLKRVSQERLAFLRGCYEQLGYASRRARYRALVAYAAYLGLVLLRRHAGDVMPARDRDELVEHLIETVL